jgi:hypothetical protein
MPLCFRGLQDLCGNELGRAGRAALATLYPLNGNSVPAHRSDVAATVRRSRSFRRFQGLTPGTTRVARARRLLETDSVDIRGGFIVGIFNYCDRWCEACPFTSRCRLFADVAEMEASLDPGLKALVDAPPLEPPPPPPPWLKELLDEMDEAMSKPADNEEPLERPLPAEHVAMELRARGYCLQVHAWLQACEADSSNDPADPRAVIAWFHTMIWVKVSRALHGLADDRPEDRDWPPDYDGSAKVALLGIDRSHAACLELVAHGTATDADVAPFIADLVWLGEALERVFPNARAFVRPGFDEPDEVSRMLASER